MHVSDASYATAVAFTKDEPRKTRRRLILWPRIFNNDEPYESQMALKTVQQVIEEVQCNPIPVLYARVFDLKASFFQNALQLSKSIWSLNVKAPTMQ